MNPWEPSPLEKLHTAQFLRFDASRLEDEKEKSSSQRR